MALILPRRKAGALDISELFSTDLYTGNGSTQTITNGIDLSGEGGLVWIKGRSVATNHRLMDSDRGIDDILSSDNTGASFTDSALISSFNSDGFSLGGGNSATNGNTNTYAAWTFRKSPSFFDVVTYTGTGAAITVSHNLGVAPGMIVVKRTDSSGDWETQHRGLTSISYSIKLNTTAAEVNTGGFSSATDSDFTTGYSIFGATYVAYLFAHDTTDNGVIQCGSYTGNGSSSGPTITLGWEPQWVMVKAGTKGETWGILDSTRSSSNPRADLLQPNLSSTEGYSTVWNFDFTPTGFSPNSSNSQVNGSGHEYIYIAIRKEGA